MKEEGFGFQRQLSSGPPHLSHSTTQLAADLITQALAQGLVTTVKRILIQLLNASIPTTLLLYGKLFLIPSIKMIRFCLKGEAR